MPVMFAPKNAIASDVFGYDSVKRLDVKAAKESKKFVVYNNILNGLSAIVSPAIGIARIISNLYIRSKDEAGGAKKEFYRMEIKRGVIELFGGGYLLWIIDIIFSLPKVRESLRAVEDEPVKIKINNNEETTNN